MDENKTTETSTTEKPGEKVTTEKSHEAGKPEVNTEKTTVEKTKE